MPTIMEVYDALAEATRPRLERCGHCRHWGKIAAWRGAGAWDAARECVNPALKAASSHPASPNHEGRPTTLPDFGCIQFEPAQSTGP